MGRINTNVQSLIAQRVLSQNSQSLNTSLERLSTGLRINRGADDPAGLIASQNLEAGQAATNQAIGNAQRTDQVANIAEGGLQEVSGLLTQLQGLLTASGSAAGLSQDEKSANQLQIDSILQTIDRVSDATNFQGMKLLNGNFDFKTSGVAAGISDFAVNGAKFSGSSLKVDVEVTTSAQQGGLFLSAGGANIDLTTGSSLVLEVSGAKGSRQLTFTSGTSIATIASTINSFSDVTGVKASTSGTGVKLFSNDFGSDQFVNVKVVNDAGINLVANGDAATPTRGVYNLQTANFNAANTTIASTFANAKNGVNDAGQDIAATINGIAATTHGKTATINTDFLNVNVTLNTANSQTLGGVGGANGAFTITGGGASFMLAGNVDISGRVSLGIQDVAARKLGDSGNGFLSSLASGQANNVVNGNVDNAQKIVTEAINQVSGLRGRLGAFQQNTVGATIRSLNVQMENTAAAESVIRDADFAAETASMTRSQILVSASTNVLSMANSQPQSVLQLLRGA